MHHGRGYKAHIDGLPFNTDDDTYSVAAGDGVVSKWAVPTSQVEFGTVDLPFASFSSYWDEATGKTKVGCSEDDPEYCPTLSALRNIETISLWGEGVKGDVKLELKRIKVAGCQTGWYAKVLQSIGVEDKKAKTDIKTFVAWVLPGIVFVGVCFWLVTTLKSWREKKHAAAVAKGEAYGDVPPVSAAVEVDILRSELVEMKKVMGKMHDGTGTSMGSTEGVNASKNMIV